jgi:acetolactate synthase I/II/III large subunit
MATNEMTGGEALARMLLAFESGPMFGMGGFQLLPFYDAARRLGLKHYLINDERCGAFAADAYAKVTGRVGVCDATLGPGATNLVTALVESLNSWKNMTQESRQLDILRPAVKDVVRVEYIERIPELVRRAFAVATSGRPGPVVLDVPEDICHATYPFSEEDFVVDPIHRAAPALRVRPSAEGVAAAVGMLRGAERPLMLCGGGVHISRAAEAVTAFAEATNMPVAHTLSGKGAVACTSDLSAGLFGRYDRIANKLIDESDLLFVVGCKLGEIATKRYTVPPKGKTVIHLDIVAEEMGRTLMPQLSLWGDARETLDELRVALAGSGMKERLAGWAGDVPKRMAVWRKDVDARLTSQERPINMARLLHELNLNLPADATLVADGGFAAHWGGLLYDTKQPGRGFVPDRGFASIGYGVPGGIGATLGAEHDKLGPVVALTGDGGFNMVMGELETARRLGLAFTVIVVNNAASGYVKALQHLMYGADAYQSSDLAETNYANVVEAFGCKGIRVERPEELGAALQAAMAEKGRPTVLDVVVTRDPAKMLPAVDNRTVQVKKGDRVA